LLARIELNVSLNITQNGFKMQADMQPYHSLFIGCAAIGKLCTLQYSTMSLKTKSINNYYSDFHGKTTPCMPLLKLNVYRYYLLALTVFISGRRQ